MNHVIELKKVDGGWFFEVDRDANHGGCGTKPTLEEALAEAAVMIPRIENYTSAQPDSKSMLCAPLNAKEQPVENSPQPKRQLRCQSRQPHGEKVQCELPLGHKSPPNSPGFHLGGEYCWNDPPLSPQKGKP